METALLSIVLVIMLMLVIGSFSITIMIASMSMREGTEEDRPKQMPSISALVLRQDRATRSGGDNAAPMHLFESRCKVWHFDCPLVRSSLRDKTCDDFPPHRNFDFLPFLDPCQEVCKMMS